MCAINGGRKIFKNKLSLLAGKWNAFLTVPGNFSKKKLSLLAGKKSELLDGVQKKNCQK